MKKPVRDLKAGEVIVLTDIGAIPGSTPTTYRMSVLRLNANLERDGVLVGRLDGTGPHSQQASVRYFQPDTLLDVEVPGLTPAQMHAEEMLGLLRTIKAMPGPWADQQRELLAKIDPPAAPTLAEALAALATLADGAQRVDAGDWQKAEADARVQARALLDRAKRAGVL